MLCAVQKEIQEWKERALIQLILASEKKGPERTVFYSNPMLM